MGSRCMCQQTPCAAGCRAAQRARYPESAERSSDSFSKSTVEVGLNFCAKERQPFFIPSYRSSDLFIEARNFIFGIVSSALAMANTIAARIDRVAAQDNLLFGANA